MIGRFLPWRHVGRPAGRRPAGERLPDRFERRLVVEPIEDRLLLSAAGTDTVSDGGTVVLDDVSHGWLTSRPLTLIVSGLDGSTSRAFGSTGPAGIERHGESTLLLDGFGNGRFETQGKVQSSSDMFYELEGTAVTGVEKQVAPTPKPVAPDDLAPVPPEGGMVDLTYAAYDRVFAEMGSIDNAVAEDSRAAERLRFAAEGDEASPLAGDIDSGPSQQDVRTLMGSRGRLAAFDLAIQQQSKSGIEIHSEGNGLESPIGTRDIPASRPTASDGVPITPAAFSRVEPRVETPSEQPRVRLVHHLADVKPAGVVDDSGKSAHEAADDETAVSDARASVSEDTPAQNTLRARAAYLDEQREKPVAQLAVALGLGHAILGQRFDARDEAKHEQLPPKKRC